MGAEPGPWLLCDKRNFSLQRSVLPPILAPPGRSSHFSLDYVKKKKNLLNTLTLGQGSLLSSLLLCPGGGLLSTARLLSSISGVCPLGVSSTPKL